MMDLPPDLPPGYVLTFAEEFDAFDWSADGHARWKTKFYFDGRTLSRNGELGFYSDATVGPDPFRLENGALVITAKPAAGLPRDLPYSTGLITTEMSFSQTYGYFEMRAQLPEGKGMWPCFWLLPTHKRWPPEIDVFEVHGDKPHRIHVNAIGVKKSANPGTKWIDVTGDVTDGYHTYGAHWTPTVVSYYFDGRKIAELPTPETMHTPMYLLASLAVGGNWPGKPDASTPFPAEMRIDHIRAYAQRPNAPAGAMAAAAPREAAPRTPTPAASPRAEPAQPPQPWTTRIPDDVADGTAGDDYLGSRHRDTRPRAGHAGNDTYKVTDFRQSVVEQPGEGIDTLELWAHTTLPPNVENAVVRARYGVQVVGNGLSNTLRGGPGDDLLDGRGGDDVLTGGPGRDVFWIRAGRGRDTVTDFKPGAEPDSDVLELAGYGLSDLAAVKAAMRQRGPDVVLTFDNGETLTLQGTDATKIVPENVRIVPVTPAVAAR
ncbi:family 16 glycosylhydrolase [Azospirillum sp.]|uniref:family 16 glycosylhydrolase n=1 Tax=Azospirillum sp. TaxID=34012 RepID=UPI002D554BE9|nr:family 16 glycosylhydrolase [Azospirillum sp.]HYD64611.1 family 16 glycosylhydrolase [Azospirillum sp.]